jgi:transposase
MCKEATDMRSSYDGLSARTKQILKKDPFSGHLFLFVNRHRNSCKCLYYDGTGEVILMKRLEKGSLFTRVNPRYKGPLVLTQAEFSIFFEGGNLERRFVESPVQIRRRSVSRLSCKTNSIEANLLP